MIPDQIERIQIEFFPVALKIAFRNMIWKVSLISLKTQVVGHLNSVAKFADDKN